MIASYVTDTQALVKFMTGLKVVDACSHQAFREVDRGDGVMIIPAVVVMEMLYLFEKQRIVRGVFHVEQLVNSRNYQIEPLGLDILKTATEIDDIPELHDRLIAATARYLNLPLITNDPVIRRSSFVTILTS